MSKLQEISTAIETGKKKIIKGLVEEALANGIAPLEILNQGMINAMGIVGEKFKANEIFVPEMLIAARAMKEGVEALKPHLAGNKAAINGKFIIGTVQGDLHDIGKNLVAMMVESAGYEVIDLGVDVSKEKFIEAIKENPDCKLIGLSALLTTTMPAMKFLVAAITEAGLRDQVKIMVGGAPISQEFADSIGADAFAADAASAAAIAKSFVA
ncbi:putative cobalamin binding protein [Desulfosporosinus orientis DSM 765]|uniref:Putative cobalamin binding protein n=1 Tax=Desulfosporosinus orientis (strain ATCC 19365 / DSM 765 / NCIMB 8382 / VKM B-1628 / Singapore I) TaxID=768706 RepID=G7W6G3_DESOD|nr:corrinoid protein [Desulfosporosinus orientis]AET68170.1 putative cobalamin binding protein [Desulfosporosinus orientis DSM 765]